MIRDLPQGNILDMDFNNLKCILLNNKYNTN